jgi:hypothetical protein
MEEKFFRSRIGRLWLAGVGRDTKALRAEAPAVEVGMDDGLGRVKVRPR